MKKKINLGSYLLQMHNQIGLQIRQHLLNYIPQWGFKPKEGFIIKTETMAPNVNRHVRSHMRFEPL